MQDEDAAHFLPELLILRPIIHQNITRLAVQSLVARAADDYMGVGGNMLSDPRPLMRLADIACNMRQAGQDDGIRVQLLGAFPQFPCIGQHRQIAEETAMISNPLPEPLRRRLGAVWSVAEFGFVMRIEIRQDAVKVEE